MKIYQKILNKFKKEEAPPYPNEFAIIDFSPIAKQNGVRDNQNKLIYRYFFDKFGNRKVIQYKYSAQRVEALKEVSHIPVFDKTEREEVLPIFAKILPSELVYKT